MKKIISIIIVLSAIILSFYLLNEILKQEEVEQVVEESEEEEVVQEDLAIEILEEGTGEEAQNGDSLKVHYTGTLEDGTKFDSSLDRGDPFVFTLGAGQVIQGWDLGLLGAKVGDKRKLTIPADLGYGETGAAGGKIPPGATLIFEIEVLEINK
jgi:FKBP-type peptidyl-prolyl cis-trans isomerase